MAVARLCVPLVLVLERPYDPKVKISNAVDGDSRTYILTYLYLGGAALLDRFLDNGSGVIGSWCN